MCYDRDTQPEKLRDCLPEAGTILRVIIILKE